MQRTTKLYTALALLAAATQALAASATKRVVLVVWDGMRPDFVTREHTPTLFQLAAKGVTFANHHPVYVSSTEVNATALATGVYPGISGIIGNNEFRPELDPLAHIMTASRSAVRRGDALTQGHFIGRATIAEILHHHHLATAVAGAKAVTLLWDRHAENEEAPDADVFEGNVLPPSLAKPLKAALGPFPGVGLPKRERDRWTTQALLGPLWQKEVPSLSVLWLSEPDYSQHSTGPGSPTALAALESCDQNLARVLEALSQRNLAAQTDVIVVSDHGFSTILENVDVTEVLKKNGFRAARAFDSPGPSAGEIMVVGNGGTVFLYVAGHDHGLIEKVVRLLQAQPFAGVLFTRAPVAGTFKLDDGNISSPAAPDIVLSLRWRADSSKNGTPGEVFSDYGEYGPGQGIHASLSRFDLHNTCIAAGPDFREGFVDQLPTGNVDITPTILAILGLKPEEKLSGRVLSEALAGSQEPLPRVESQRIEATSRRKSVVWKQYLKFSEVNGVRYLVEGNGESEPAGAAAKN